MMNDDIQEILISEKEIQTRIAELGKQLEEDYAGKEPIFVGVLRGVVVFFSDMIRASNLPCKIDLLSVSSYGSGTVSSGHVTMSKDVSLNIKGKDVIILEDIIDSGNTLSYVKDHLLSMEPASLKICAFLDKPSRRQVPITAEYVGFTIPDKFVVGYGLDYDDRYRNLPFIGVLKPEVYEK